VIVKTGSTFGKVAQMGEIEHPITLNPQLAVFKEIKCDKRFLYYYLVSPYIQSIVQLSNVGSTIPTMTQQAVLSFFLPLPPLPEQTAIAAFLDRETAKIDALVGEQEKLIALLKEKRQAVISHAVTKGLDPNVKMKDSGVEWLGEVPEEWVISKSGHYVIILSGFAFPSIGFNDDVSCPKLLRGVNVGVGQLRWDDTVYWRRSIGDGLDNYEIDAGDIVLGMDRPIIGNGVRVAKVKPTDLPCLLLQRVALLKTGPGLNPDFLLSFLISNFFVSHFSPETTGVSVPHISPEQIKDFIISVPPLIEQSAIVAFLDCEIAKIDILVVEAEKGIALLEERRSALISAAVTGQIDVRKVI